MSSHTQPVHVAVAVITAPDGTILLTRRASNKHQGGLWEFPGGKRDPDESAQDALARELREELAIEVTAAEPLISIPYQYPDLHVLLDVFRVTAFSGTPRGAEGQPMQWVTPGQLDDIPLPAANRPIVRAIQLPDRYLVTPDLADADQLYKGILAATTQNHGLIQLRTPSLAEHQYWHLTRQLLQNLPAQVQLLCKGEAGQILPLPRAGWHLTSTQLKALAGQARPLPEGRLLAASCHNARELELAARLGCDFATLSPVQPTASHPDTLALGWEQARQLTLNAQLPVYFLGGMTPADIGKAVRHGAQGIAAIRSLWPL